MTSVNVITRYTTPAAPAWLESARRPFHADLYAFFSSEFNGIITDPLWMRVPVDDHLVHRGDGVFETLKCVSGRVYCLREHLDRLYASAREIGLAPPGHPEHIREIILEVLRAGERRDALIRVLVSRGPGSMGVSPYDCPSPHLYILAHRLPPAFMEQHPEGARLALSRIPVKAGLLATIKTCNYLPNALLKKDAVDQGADFAVNLDECGFIAEGATENVGLVTPEGGLLVPRPGRILPGTTLNRALALAEQGLREGWLTSKGEEALTPADLNRAAEILIFGTTTNVTAVTTWNGRPVADGRPGPVAKHLGALLVAEQQGDNPYTTRAFA
ncbi:MAG TPA: aminotransferase class IV [Kiritimatiellia bacterium]|nr:aminotransferase class IV [Kiritimatiellia bacterium]HMO99200.1 aminotransferase class IV [Kiritimatiellia bacterium]HMP95787.1 aminotransferase class IV [Kiritimatiellia bacterium]